MSHPSKPPEQERGEERLTDEQVGFVVEHFREGSGSMSPYSRRLVWCLEELVAHRGREEIREANETIRELQRDLCAYAGVPLPSERERFDAVRAKAIEECARLAESEYASDRYHGTVRDAARRIAGLVRSLKPTHEG